MFCRFFLFVKRKKRRKKEKLRKTKETVHGASPLFKFLFLGRLFLILECTLEVQRIEK